MEPNVTLKQERELNARIAEKVMHEHVAWVKSKPYLADDKGEPRTEHPVPAYCTNIGAAMTVAFQLRRLGFIIHIRMDERGTTLAVTTGAGEEVCRYENIITRFAQYICQAALVAVGEERRKGEDRRK